MNKVFIIAEAGVNHNGSIELAKKLIDVAVEAKVDAVKFQTFKAENLVSKNAQKADYQKQTTNKEESQFDMIKKLELDVDTHKELISYCRSKNIMFLSLYLLVYLLVFDPSSTLYISLSSSSSLSSNSWSLKYVTKKLRTEYSNKPLTCILLLLSLKDK